IGAEPLVARLAFDERIDESLDVAGGFPHLTREDDAGIEADDVVATLHHRAPPFALDVVLQLDTERPVVPGGTQAAVDLTRRKDDPSPLAEADDGVETIGAGHVMLHPAGGRR